MNTRVPQLNFVFDRRKVATLTRKASVELRVTHNYKQKYISTGIMLSSNQWRDGKIVNCPDIMEISQTLDSILSDVRQIILDMMSNNTLNRDCRQIIRRNTTIWLSISYIFLIFV